MTYIPVNVDAYTNAFAGALAGMAISGWIIDPNSSDYANVAAIAGAFSEAFDTVWNNATSLNWAEMQSIQSICQGQFTGHAPGSLNNNVFSQASNWAVPAAACAALVLEGDAYITGQGIFPIVPLTTPINVETFGANVNASPGANVTALTRAVAYAVANSNELSWTHIYNTDASIPLLHTVRHHGPGGIRRGADVFYVDPMRGQLNNLYCSNIGDPSNDGLSSLQPITLVATATVLSNYGPMLDGTWQVNLAAGTYSPGAQTTIDGLQSRNPLRFVGPAVAYGVPTAVVDGTGTLNGVCGLYFRNQVRALVRDIKFQNFASTDACGVIADRWCELSCDNVHSTGNDLAGIDAEASTRLYVTGGTHTLNNFYNIRAYGQCLVSIGYNSVTHRITIGDALHAGGSGILVRDNSSGHIDYCDINGVHDGGGIELLNQSRVHLVSCVFGGTSPNYYNIKSAPLCTFIDDGTNTFNPAIAKSIVQFGFGIDSTSQQLAYYDVALGWFKWGRKDSLTPKALFDVQDVGTAVWGGSFNTNVLFGVDSSANAYIGLGAGNASECGLMFADVAGNRQGQIAYLHSSDTMLLRVNAADSFRLHSTYLKPEIDNTVTLGVSGQTFQKLWLLGNVQILTGNGSPEGVVTAVVSSLYLRRDGGAATSLYVKESGSGNTGWIGK